MLIVRIVDEDTGSCDRAVTAGKRRRRGATAMEYLVCASFILVVVISAVQYFGSRTNGLMDKSATATTPKQGP